MENEKNRKAQKFWPSEIIEKADKIEILRARGILTDREIKGLLRGKSLEELDAEKEGGEN